MKRTLSAVLLAVTLSLTGACSASQSGDSFRDNPVDEPPGIDAGDPDAVEEEDG